METILNIYYKMCADMIDPFTSSTDSWWELKIDALVIPMDRRDNVHHEIWNALKKHANELIIANNWEEKRNKKNKR